MAKPIFLIGFPMEAESSSMGRVYADLETKLGMDYHVLVYKTSEVKDASFNVLNAVNATDIQIEDLIQKTREEINQLIKQNVDLQLNSIVNNLTNNNDEHN